MATPLLPLFAFVLAATPPPYDGPSPAGIFARDNLIAWCIVPFDSKNRGPEERAAMLRRLGFKHFAYDWRAEHVPTFDAEIKALKKEVVALDAFWLAPGDLNDQSRNILQVLERNQVRASLWALLDFGPDKAPDPAEQEKRINAAVAKLGPLAREAERVGCSVALYNHGGWFGEPENQAAIVERLKKEGYPNVGIVYNLHHGHDHLDRLPAVLKLMMPHLVTLNLNGMDRDGEKVGRKILPLGQGELDLEVLKTIVASGYKGPIGILGHTQDDAEARLSDNLDGLDWLVNQLEGLGPGPRPVPRTPVPPRPKTEQDEVADLIRASQEGGDARRGAQVFTSPRYACQSCHKVGDVGGEVGPALTTVGACLKPGEMAEALLWPRRQVKPGYEALTVVTTSGRSYQGHKLEETEDSLVLRVVTSGERLVLAKADIDESRNDGSLMPEGLAQSMTPEERRDLFRFLSDLGRSADAAEHVRVHAPATFAYGREPIHPECWPNREHRINRDRVYDFYTKEAAFFRTQSPRPMLLPQYPGLDGGTLGHWGNQNEEAWVDDRWNETDLGTLLSGTFRGAGVTVPKGVCVRLGERGNRSVCFNPETLCYEALWMGGFVSFEDKRHGFLGGLKLQGTPLPRPEGRKPSVPFVYHGFYRHGPRVVFAYRLGDVEMLDSPWVNEDGHFTRLVGSREGHPLAELTHGGPPNWPQVLETKGRLGNGRPYAIDTITVPFENPWKAPLFFGDHDFLPDGTAFLCTMQGDVWRVEDLDATLDRVRWRRVASGLHQALGLVVVDGKVCVLGRDQITRLHDLNGDGEADFYECVSNAHVTSTGGHDFISGLQRDAQGRFYTASSNQGVLRITPETQSVEVLATGLRNPDGLGLTPDGVVTVPSSEGDWVPASMVCQMRPGAHYGAKGPRDNQPPDLPLVYLPRGMDNSSGAQVTVTSDRWGLLKGQMVHFSYGAGTHFLLVRDEVDGQPQGAIVPLVGDFRSGSHRGRFAPHDGQLYVSGMGGWGTYTPDDGSFQRVRYTGDPVCLPIAWQAHQNGVFVRFSSPIATAQASDPASHFAQVWNYRYSEGYGSQEYAPTHPGVAGHEALTIKSAHVLDDGTGLFLELPDIQPVNQLHLQMNVGGNEPVDMIATVHKLAPPFTGFPGYAPVSKTIAAHPILADMSALLTPPVPNPYSRTIPNAVGVTIETGPNLSFATRSFKVRAGQPVKFTLVNPDVVPHNWVLARPGTLAKVGDLSNKLIAEPDAAARQYVPRTDDVLAYTDIVAPSLKKTIHFIAPKEPGRYPYLCTFPGHWMVMNGEMIVE
jgi:putative heme-binding domain-containing protein